MIFFLNASIMAHFKLLLKNLVVLYPKAYRLNGSCLLNHQTLLKLGKIPRDEIVANVKVLP